ncbi:Hypothetical protein FKW44_018734 [Caligus rogercresseyi]|uniref:Uncharacterized protein n=1 Tax=Caligus rogercresseyi TaxID=217165 RepID=A0A7T8GUV6_CALRO|nr:Hypothetical protein FKW44_018734 [Caligus rogercresseyi]
MEREEARIGIMRSEVEAAQNNAHESARRNAKILQELERSTSELENALDIKNKLKDKCQELKAKLENLKTAYKDRLAETGRIHEAAARLEARSELHEEQALKAAAQLANREKAHREELEELRRQGHGQETRISELKQEVTRLEDQVEDARQDSIKKPGRPMAHSRTSRRPSSMHLRRRSRAERHARRQRRLEGK